MHGFLENATPTRKSYTERLQDIIDNPVSEITKFRRWKIKKLAGLGHEFVYKTGLADSVDIIGTVENPEVVRERLPVSLLIHEPTRTRVLWQRTEDDQASILIVDRPRHLQGNPYKLLPALDKAFDIIFNQQGYHSIFARAGKPIKDVGIRGGKDWRDTKVMWRTKSNSIRPVMIPKLQSLWLRLIKNCVPAKCFGSHYPETGIIILSPNELKELDKSALEELDALHGDAKRHWKFTDNIE
ncbi:hypothetical protein OAF65_10770 [Verrucomicrobiales bacterium]|nr:hypothetical protein [Verrucomicrobiales bacterium]